MKKLATVLIALLVFAVTNATVTVSIPKAEAQGTTLKISKVYSLNQTGSTFFVNVTIEGVAELGGWITSLKWDPNITSISTGDTRGIRKGRVYYNIYQGGFMVNQSSTNFLCNAVDNVNGTITNLGCYFVNAGPSVSGSGLLAVINFTIKNVGTTAVNVTTSIVADRTGHEVDHATENGLITDQPPPPPPPIWMNRLFQTAVVLFFVVVVLPAVVIVRLRRKVTLTEKDMKEIEEYEEEVQGEPLPEDSQETSKEASTS